MPELAHMSFSTWNTYTTCPRAMYLGKVRNAWSRGAFFFLSGTAVHEAVEARLKGESYDVRENFYRLVRDQMQTDPDICNWKHGTYEDKPAVNENALKLAEDCIQEAYRWLDEELSEVTMIEADVTGMLPGCEVPVKGFVDILGVHKKHGPIVGDWKSSASKPKNNFQLETYAALLEVQGIDRYETGLWMMLRPGASRARPINLADVGPAKVGAEYQRVYEKIKEGIFPTEHSQWNCRMCVQDLNCSVQSPKTERSLYYDDVGQKFIPF